MNCAYCMTGLHHMVCILKPDGTFHIHAPFYDKKVIDKFIKAILKETKNYKETKRG